MSKRRLTVAAGIIVMALSSAAIAAPGEGRHGKTRGEKKTVKVERMARALDLTADQQAAWTRLHEAFSASSKPIHEAMKANRKAMKAELESDSADADAIGQLHIDNDALRSQLEAMRASLKTDLRAVLTPEQQEKWDSIAERRAKRHGDRHRRGDS